MIKIFNKIFLTIIVLIFFFNKCNRNYSGDYGVLLEEENSPFGKVSVYEEKEKRILYIGDDPQSGIYLKDNNKWLYSYVQLAVIGTMTWEGIEKNKKAKVLVLGLGGGIYPNFIIQKFPEWEIEVVELNPVVAKFARKYFNFSEKIPITIQDARKYLTISNKKYDIIFMDAFGEDFIPPELYTREYYSLLKKKLDNNGLILLNSWEKCELEEYEYRTLADVFSNAKFVIHPIDHSNRIYIYMNNLSKQEEQIKPRIRRNWTNLQITVPHFEEVLNTLSSIPYNPKLEILTDSNIHSIIKNNKKL
jgi:spermidine synthase